MRPNTPTRQFRTHAADLATMIPILAGFLDATYVQGTFEHGVRRFAEGQMATASWELVGNRGRLRVEFDRASSQPPLLVLEASDPHFEPIQAVLERHYGPSLA